MKLFLMGYMGAGKSTIGQILANNLNYDFLDLDVYISEKEAASVSEIFNRKGELYFRKKETVYLKEVLAADKKMVVALGGGTPCYGNNLNLILESDKSFAFYLKLSVKGLADRLYNNHHNRPLLSFVPSYEKLLEYIGKHLFERNSYYSQAHQTINIDNKTQQQVVDCILEHYSK